MFVMFGAHWAPARSPEPTTGPEGRAGSGLGPGFLGWSGNLPIVGILVPWIQPPTEKAQIFD